MKSPLGSFYPESSGPPRRRHAGFGSRVPRRLAVGIAVLAALPGLGAVLAPQVSLGSQDPIEFGQGSAAVAACDSSILIALGTEWYPSGSFFRLTKITLSDVDTRVGYCYGKTLTVSVLDASGSQLDLTPPDDATTALTYTVSAAGSQNQIVELSVGATVNLDSTSVARVTVETS